RQPHGPRGRMAGDGDRRGRGDPDAPRPVRPQPRLPRPPRGERRARPPRRLGPRAGARGALRLERGTVRALVYLGPRRMEVQEAPDPNPGPGEVVLETAAAAICGSDLHGFREASPRRIPPLVMGHEAVGRVAAVGTGVDPARVGQ